MNKKNLAKKKNINNQMDIEIEINNKYGSHVEVSSISDDENNF